MQHLWQINNLFVKRLSRTLLGFVLLFFLLLLFPLRTEARDLSFTCPNRFVTLVNPVRGRSFWLDQTLNPIKDQYSLIKAANFSATWLLQYEALIDPQLTEYLNTFDFKQEFGVFLEITLPLTNQVKVVYPHATAWASPKAIFLSGYTRSERRKLIDEIFEKYKENFGNYPKSVGAWWIDSYSIEYMVSSYKITSVMIVADQKTTDHYGVWGQWWGVAYYPSRLNVLVPALNSKDKVDVVVTQWAQRDFLQAMGEGYSVSNYSLQANDYLKQGKNISYFSDLVAQYSDCRNKISQVTVGLETGMESVSYINEYKKQLELFQGSKSFQVVTMSNFYNSFKKAYPGIVDGYFLGENDKVWFLTPQFRENKFLGDRITYPRNTTFADYFIKDTSAFLRRYVQDLSMLKNKTYLPYWFFIFIGLLFIFLKKINWKYTLLFTVFIFFSYYHVFISFEKYGWRVLFGPQIQNLVLTQLILISLPLGLFYLVYTSIKKKPNLIRLLYFLPLTFAFDYLATLFKFSLLNGFYYFGIFWQKTCFLGVKISEKLLSINLVKQNFDIGLASNFLCWSIDKLFTTPILWILIYPLTHLLIAYLLVKIYKRLTRGFRKAMVIILVVFLAVFIYILIEAEPRLVLPIT